MIDFFKKLKRYGIRRAIVYVLIKSINAFKVLMYRLIYSNNSPKLNNVKIYLPTQYVGKGCIELNGCQLGVWPSPYFINSSGYIEARADTAKIKIGAGTAISNNFVIIADKTSISIGDNCLIGPNLFIVDSDFHGIDISDRRGSDYHFGSVSIGNDVFIGEGVKILKSSVIGNGSVIASGSIVVGSLDPLGVYGGIPAKKIGEVKNE